MVLLLRKSYTVTILVQNCPGTNTWELMGVQRGGVGWGGAGGLPSHLNSPSICISVPVEFFFFFLNELTIKVFVFPAEVCYDAESACLFSPY